MAASTPSEELKARLAAASFRELATDLGFSAAYLNEVAKGRRPMSERLLKALGFEKAVTYRRKRKARTA